MKALSLCCCCCCSNPRFHLVVKRFTVGRKRQCGLLDVWKSALQQQFQVCTMIKNTPQSSENLSEVIQRRRNVLRWDLKTAVASGQQQGLGRWAPEAKALQPRACCHIWGSYRLPSVCLSLPLHPHTHTHIMVHVMTHNQLLLSTQLLAQVVWH